MCYANPFVFHFINHNKGAGSNWENWVFICTNNGGASTGGDSENFVLRADAWGWGSKWDIEGNHTLNQSFVWDTYPADMNGAECWVGVSHEGSTVRVSESLLRRRRLTASSSPNTRRRLAVSRVRLVVTSHLRDAILRCWMRLTIHISIKSEKKLIKNLEGYEQ